MKRKIPVGCLTPDPVAANSCPEITNEEVQEVSENGIESPLLVRPLGEKYGVLANAKGYLAAEVAGFDEVSCIVRRDLDSDADAVKVSFRESENYTPWRVLRAVELLRESDPEGSTGEIARALAVPEPEVERYLRISKLPYHVKVCLKVPWNLTDEDRSNLSEKGISEGTVGTVSPNLCDRLARSGRFVELAENCPVKAHEAMKLVGRGSSVREAVHKVKGAGGDDGAD